MTATLDFGGGFVFPLTNYVNTNEYDQRRLGREFFNYQAQQQVVWKNHTFMAGFDYFSGHLKYKYSINSVNNINQYVFDDFYYFVFGTNFWDQFFINNGSVENFKPPDRSYTFYLLDYWQVHPKLLVEAGVFKDYSKNSRVGFDQPISNSLWNFRLGLNFFATKEHTFRFLIQRNMNTHYFTTASLIPPQVAGFPWQINIDEGGITREIGAAWEAQWTPKTFTVVQLDANRIDNPIYEPFFGANNEILANRAYWGWKRYVASATLNQILTPSLGLACGVAVKKIDPSINTTSTELSDFSELDTGFTISYLHHTGWQGFWRNYFIYQNLTEEAITGIT